MSYIVFARKYRPQIFDEVVAQESIVNKLKGAVESGKLANGYLFCGPRGVGKTSCARILAKSLNCDKGPTVKPCGKCPACIEISKGTSFDVIEIDGASNRGIDDIKTLRENVKFAPNYGKYKIYIIDEVHQITSDGFNALLKTLEEPPSNVVFIFATTAPNKVPATIISRCQRFDFRMMPIKSIESVLSEICKKEKINADSDALFAIAKSAKGGMRDALSVLDQLSASLSRKIIAEDVNSMLGLVEIDFLFKLAECIADKDSVNALNTLEDIIDEGKDVRQLIKDLIEHFRNLMIVKIGKHSLGKLIDYPSSVKDMLLSQSNKFDLDKIIYIIDMFMNVQDVSKITDTIYLPLEVALAKLTYKKDINSEGAFKASEKTEETKDDKTNVVSGDIKLSNNRGHIDISGMSENIKKEAEEKKTDDLLARKDLETVVDNVIIDLKRIRRLWDFLTHAVSKHKMSIATYLQEGVPIEFSDNLLIIAFEPDCMFQKEALENGNNKKFVEGIFSEKLRTNIIIRYKIKEKIDNKIEDPKLTNILDVFGGKVIHKWHNE